MKELKGIESKRLVEKPTYDFTVQWYLNTYSTLSKSRSIGMVSGYIPASEIIYYGTEVGHIEDELSDFLSIIQAMDDVHVSHYNKK